MTPRTRTGTRHDLTWRRGDLAVLIVLALGAGALLAARGLNRAEALGPKLLAAGRPARLARELVNPNVASVDSLRRLPRIGPVLANAIVEARRSDDGPFKDLADLQGRVRRIGPVTAETIRPFITFDEAGT